MRKQQRTKLTSGTGAANKPKPVKVNLVVIIMTIMLVGALLGLSTISTLAPPKNHRDPPVEPAVLSQPSLRAATITTETQPPPHEESQHIVETSGTGHAVPDANMPRSYETILPPIAKYTPVTNPRYFMVFSTSCSPFQNWQSLAYFHHARKVGQKGNVTRLVSGCSEEQAQELREYHEKHIVPMSPYFQMHISPDYGHQNNQKYWNKPHGLLDYMKVTLGFPERAKEYENDIIMIVDPDMMLMRPISHTFHHFNAEWSGVFTDQEVVHGRPFAQRYGFGAGWLTSLKGHLPDVVPPNSPALNVNLTTADRYFPAGPPYIGTAYDMFDIATNWVDLLPKINVHFTGFMQEMHAYSTAAAHLELDHQLAKNFMVSDVEAGEVYGFLDIMPHSQACVRGAVAEEDLPLVFHYCQRYSLGRYFFSKYKLREDFFECNAPLLREPPENLGDIYDWYVFPNGNDVRDFSKPGKEVYITRNGWMLCTALYGINEVAEDFKGKYCENPNLNKTYIFHQQDKFQFMVDHPVNPFQTEDEALKEMLLGPSEPITGDDKVPKGERNWLIKT